jgi:hypothetical protein
MVRLGDWKLTYQPLVDGAIWKLFNVREDPGCKKDVLESYPEISARLRALLEAWMAADTANEVRPPSPQGGLTQSPIMEQ